MEGWYAVRAKRLEYALLKVNLERKGFEVYDPCIMVEKDNGRVELKPYFPQYMFCKLDPDNNGHQVTNTPGLQQALINYGRVDDLLIQEIKSRVEQVNSGKAPVNQFEVGQAVSLKGIQGLEAIFQEHRPWQRCTLLLKFLGEYRLIEAKLSQIARL